MTRRLDLRATRSRVHAYGAELVSWYHWTDDFVLATDRQATDSPSSLTGVERTAATFGRDGLLVKATPESLAEGISLVACSQAQLNRGRQLDQSDDLYSKASA
jgi:hypothetical protein